LITDPDSSTERQLIKKCKARCFASKRWDCIEECTPSKPCETACLGLVQPCFEQAEAAERWWTPQQIYKNDICFEEELGKAKIDTCLNDCSANSGEDVAVAVNDIPPPEDLPADGWKSGTTTNWITAKYITIDSPSLDSKDMLFLFLSRSDARQPMVVPGWTRAAECFKSYNSQSRCMTYDDCTTWSDYKPGTCDKFPTGTGADLNTVVFYRMADPSTTTWTFDVSWVSKPTWAIMTAINSDYIDTSNPIRSVGSASNDGSYDSIFPSIYGKTNDILLLSMAFDDAVAESKFGPPPGTELIGYKSYSDEAGFLFGKRLTSDGQTGTLRTQGSGAASNKDALIAITLRGKP